MNTIYYKYSDYLKNKYGQKVYKLPINLPVTCPNRDGILGNNGCSFCADIATGFESLDNQLTVKEQLLKNMEYMGKRYKANKFIAYFQNYTNTYLPLTDFKKYIKEALIENIVEISISTRPDSLNEDYLKYLYEIKTNYNVNISIELGLQSINHKTLKKINRGHTLAEYIDAVLMIQKYDFEICTHLILNLPFDDEDDILEAAKILSSLKISGVKLHSLYIPKNSMMAKEFLNNELNLISLEDYKKRVIMFLRYLSKDIVIHRLLGRAPEKDTLFCNWNTSWWKIKDDIEFEMNEKNYKQGDLCNYLNGKALKNINR